MTAQIDQTLTMTKPTATCASVPRPKPLSVALVARHAIDTSSVRSISPMKIPNTPPTGNPITGTTKKPMTTRRGTQIQGERRRATAACCSVWENDACRDSAYGECSNDQERDKTGDSKAGRKPETECREPHEAKPGHERHHSSGHANGHCRGHHDEERGVIHQLPKR